jgi:hypothetical protein
MSIIICGVLNFPSRLSKIESQKSIIWNQNNYSKAMTNQRNQFSVFFQKPEMDYTDVKSTIVLNSTV